MIIMNTYVSHNFICRTKIKGEKNLIEKKFQESRLDHQFFKFSFFKKKKYNALQINRKNFRK